MFVSFPALVSFPAEDRLILLPCFPPACFHQPGHFKGGPFLGAPPLTPLSIFPWGVGSKGLPVLQLGTQTDAHGPWVLCNQVPLAASPTCSLQGVR